MKSDEESLSCVREEKANIFDESMKQRDDPEKKDGGSLDPSNNEHCFGKKEKDFSKSDVESLSCVREEKANILLDESMKQREEPEKDGGPLDLSKYEHCFGKKEERFF